MRPFQRLALCTASLIVTLAMAAPARGEDSWWGTDKALHLGAGALFGAATYGILFWGQADGPGTRAILSSVIGTLPGVAKEIYDAGQPGNHFCVKDLVWTAIGATAISLALFGLEMALRQSKDDDTSTQRNLQLVYRPIQGIAFDY